MDDFLDNLEHVLQELNRQRQKILGIGDMNIKSNSLTGDNVELETKFSERFENMLISCGLNVMNGI